MANVGKLYALIKTILSELSLSFPEITNHINALDKKSASHN